jgi:6-phosphogluconolactonase
VSDDHVRTVVSADADALMAVAAETIVRCATESVNARGRFVIAWSGGSTPQALYRLLAGSAYDKLLPWSATTLLWGDERCVPPDDPDSNYGAASRSGLLGRSFASVERMRGELGADDAALDYERRLLTFADAGPASPGPVRSPVIDLVLLGIGDDGHTASLLPGAATLSETFRLVVPTEVYAGVRRVTLTMPVLAAARGLLFLAAGAGKAAVVAEILGDAASPLPAAIVLRAARRVTVLLDRAAAAGAEVAPDPGVV